MNKKLDISPLLVYMLATARGREPPDAMSLCYADMTLTDLLDRSRLRYTVNEPPLYRIASLKLLVFKCRKNFLYFFRHSGINSLSKRSEALIHYYKKWLIMTSKVVFKTWNIFYAKMKTFREHFLTEVKFLCHYVKQMKKIFIIC